MAYIGVPVTAIAGGTGRAGNNGGMTINGGLFGQGNSPIGVANPLTNGQLYIGNTGSLPTPATLSAGANININNTPGGISISATGSGYTPPNEAQIYYVRDNGSNSNSGLNIEAAVLTFTYALSLIAAQSPGSTNRFVIATQDDGIYPESITVPSYVDIYAPNATLGDGITGGSISIGDNTNIVLGSQNVLNGSVGIFKTTGTGTSSAFVRNVTCQFHGCGAICQGGILNYSFTQMSLINGEGIGAIGDIGPLTTGTIIVNGQKITITGNGYAVSLNSNTAAIIGNIDYINTGINPAAQAVFITTGTINLSCAQIAGTSAISLAGAASILNLQCTNISGTRAVTGGAVFNLDTCPATPANQTGMLNGQLAIGNSTSGIPVVNTLTAGANVTITNGPGTISIASAAGTPPNEANIYYVRSNGSNTNSGLNMPSAVQTFAKAISLAIAQSPSATNRFAIVCLDDGIYPEGLTLPSFVDIFAPNATLGSGTAGGFISINDSCNVQFNTLNIPNGDTGIYKSVGTGDAYVNINYVIVTTSCQGFICSSGTLHVSFKKMTVAAGGWGLGFSFNPPSSPGNILVTGDIITVTGNGVAITSATTGYIQGFIGTISAPSGTAIFGKRGSVSLYVGQVNAAAAYNLDATAGPCSLALNCGSFSGTSTTTNGATANVWTPPAPMSNGQLIIGSSGSLPVVSNITAGANITITNGPGSLLITAAGGGLPPPNQTNIIWVRSNGSDSNSGLNIDVAVLTFTHAASLAAGLSPSPTNRVVICCMDDGIYTDNPVLPNNVDLYAPNATIGNGSTGGQITLGNTSVVTLGTLVVPNGGTGIISSVTTGTANVQQITCLGTAIGVGCYFATGTTYLNFNFMNVATGLGIDAITNTTCIVKGGDIYVSGSGGVAVDCNGIVKGTITRIYSAAGVGSAIFALAAGVVSLDVDTINVGASGIYAVATGTAPVATVYLTCKEWISGTRSVSGGALVYYNTVPLQTYTFSTGPTVSTGILDGQIPIGNTTTGGSLLYPIVPGTDTNIQNNGGSILIGSGVGMNLIYAADTNLLANVTGTGTTYEIPFNNVYYNAYPQSSFGGNQEYFPFASGYYYFSLGLFLTGFTPSTPGVLLNWLIFSVNPTIGATLNYSNPSYIVDTAQGSIYISGGAILPGKILTNWLNPANPQPTIFNEINVQGQAQTISITRASMLIFKVA